MPPRGYFDETSVLRRVQGQQIVGLAGPRALLMQATHPVAFAGFFEVTGSLTDPYARLRRTAAVLNAIGFGTREQADRMTRRVRAMHARARGVLDEPAGPFPAGTPWAADDPDLLLWILGCLVDSSLLVHRRYVGPLAGADAEAYWQDWRVVGELFGLPRDRMPGTLGDFEDYMRGMLASGDLHVTPEARELAVDIVMRPPLPPALLPLRELINQITVGLLPGEIRRLYGFRWDPLRGLALHAGAEHWRRVVGPLLPSRVRLVAAARG